MKASWALPVIALLGFSFASAEDVEEQAYVYVKSIAWCKNPECLNGRHWRIHRTTECKYETRRSVIRSICNITVDKDWRTSDNWLMRVWGPKPNYENNPSDDYHFFYLQKLTFNGIPQYSISWNANMEGEPAYDSAQWNLGEDYSYLKNPDRDIHTIIGHGSEIVLDFELSLLKYPEPESTTWSDYFNGVETNTGVLVTNDKLVILHKARIRELMGLKLEQIKSNPYAEPDYIDKLTKAAIGTQKAWEEYAIARSEETSASYDRGSGAPLAFSMRYLDLQIERIKDLLVVYK